MRTINYFWLAGTVGLVSLLLCGTISYSQTARPTVQLTTDRPINQLVPYEAEAAKPQDPIQIELQAVDAAGQPLQAVDLHVQLFTPPSNPWLTTDFPIVEGTKLLELSTFAPRGKLQFQQMLPIRGNYQIVVDVASSTNQFAAFQQKLTLSVPENWVKYRNFGIVALIILAAGLGGGFVIGGSQQLRPGEVAPQRVRLLLSGAIIAAIVALLAVNLSSVAAHHHAEKSFVDAPNQQSQGLQLQISGDTAAMVGQPARLTAQLKDSQTNQLIQDILFNVKVTSLEAGWTALSYQAAPDSTGQLTWQQQFFDGAPHQIQVKALPQPQSNWQFQPFQATQTIQVEGVMPPLSGRLTTLFYWVLFLLAGLAIGFYTQRRLISRSLLRRSYSR